MTNMSEEDRRVMVAEKRGARMHEIDKLPRDIRELVHDYGYTTVRALMDVGIRKSNHIRHVVETILNEFSPTRGTYSNQGIRKDVETGKPFRKTESMTAP